MSSSPHVNASRKLDRWTPSRQGESTGRPFTATELESLAAGSLRSARRIVPLVMDLIRPKSVIDIGCGLGEWLAVFQDHGVEDVLGVDGAGLETDMLRIAGRRFHSHNLREPLDLEHRFDLVVCLEVVEHLSPEIGRGLVETLTGLGPAVLFSAAIPGQGGLGHVNEQWPDYWADLFADLGYVPVDCLREEVWADPEVDFWYRQNTLLYVDPAEIERLGSVTGQALSPTRDVRRLVHPTLYERTRWHQHAAAAAREILELLLALDDRQKAEVTGKVLLLDDAKLDLSLPSGCGWELAAFPQRDGIFSGRPAQGEEAVSELERLRCQGGALLAIVWPAFWWLDSYPAFREHLRQSYPCRVETENLRLFDLRSRELQPDEGSVAPT